VTQNLQTIIRKFKKQLMSLSLIIALGLPVSAHANRQPLCAPDSIVYNFPNESVSGITRSIELKFLKTEICKTRENHIANFVIKEATLLWGQQELTVPSRCIITKPIDIGSVSIEKTGDPSIRIKVRDEAEWIALYFIDEEFICMKFSQ